MKAERGSRRIAAVLITASQKYKCPPGTGILKMLRDNTIFIAASSAVKVSHVTLPRLIPTVFVLIPIPPENNQGTEMPLRPLTGSADCTRCQRCSQFFG